MKPSKLEELLYQLIMADGLSEPLREYRFCKRMWRFDLCYPDRMIAIECNGGIYKRGRHSFGTGLEKDYEKLNRAQLLGWKVLQYSMGMILDGTAIKDIKEALCK
jgi:hypothetical protein